MPRTRSLLSVVGILVATLGLAFAAWAGGPGGGEPASCQVLNPGAGAVAIRGTVAVEAQRSDAVATPVDYTLRLARTGATPCGDDPAGKVCFFRLSLEAIVFGKSNEDVLCLALEDPGLSAQILAGFNLPPTRRLVITDKSITNAEVQGPDQVIPGTGDPGRASTLGDVVIYACTSELCRLAR
jgi:hypothetical protein